jgi:2-desacetyl-2-hydroxyethyl bacteriochlorophyllide A dehydrogenase
MKAVIYHKKEEHSPITIEDVPKPEPNKGEVLVKIKYCGICGSDLEAYKDRAYPFDAIIGHELTGTIDMLGPEVKRWKPGQRVTIDPNIPCGQCFACRNGKANICNKIQVIGVTLDGGCAEYVSVPNQNLIALPEQIIDKHGTVFDQIGTALHSLHICNFRFGETAAIIGLGTIGLFLMQCLKYAGASKIVGIDINMNRVEVAKKFNPDLVLNTISNKKIKKITRKGGPDYVFNCTSAPLIDHALDMVRKAGKVVQLGFREKSTDISFFKILMNEYSIFGSYGYLPQDFIFAVDLVARKAIDPGPIVTKIISIDDIIEEGFEYALDPETKDIKILVEP